MSEDQQSNTASSEISQLRRFWPWGQIGWFLAGMGFCLMAIGDTGVVLGFDKLDSGDGLKGGGTLIVLIALMVSVVALVVKRRATRRGITMIHLMWLRTVNFSLLATSISLMMLSLIVPAVYSARIANANAVAAGPWRNHVLANAALQISTPGNWELFADPDISSSAIRLVDRTNDLHLLAVVTPKQDLAVQTLSELAQQSAQTLGKSATNVTISESQRGESDGRPALDGFVTGTFEGINLCCYFRHVELPDAWVELRQWTTRSRFEANEATFLKIAGSLRSTH